MMYNLTLKAANPDGEVATDAMAVKLPPTGEKLYTVQTGRGFPGVFSLAVSHVAQWEKTVPTEQPVRESLAC